MLFNSRRYQSETVREGWSVGAPMQLRGPWLRRLAAEQLWDSTLTLLVPDLDERKSSRGDLSYLRELTEISADELWKPAGENLEIRRYVF
jgi:hypothetical protein